MATVMLWRARGRRTRERRGRVRQVVPPPRLELPELAVGVSLELATLASGVEGNAQLLCESMTTGDALEQHVEHLCAAVRRLRTLSETIQFAVSPIEVHPQPTCIDDVFASVQHELGQGPGRFQVTLDLASSVPEVHTDPRALRQTMLLLAEVLFGRAPGAHELTLRSRNAIDESAHAVVVEMIAEAEDDVPKQTPRPAHLALAHEAATRLLAALGAEWILHVDDCREATARIALPAAEVRDAVPDAVETGEAHPPHDFGGALVLASNPSVRYMVGQELERAGRQVFLCAEGMAARTLWQATPDRFELLILETHGMGEELAVEAIASSPNTRTILLGRSELPELAAAAAAQPGTIAMVPQPFGLMELRAALAHVGMEASRVPT